MVSLAVGVLVYGLLLGCWIPRITVRASAGASAEPRAAPGVTPRGLSRRAALLITGFFAAAWVVRRITGAEPDARRAPVDVTPNNRFYQISKNYPLDPTVDPATWSLDVRGLVRVPLTLSYAAFLERRPGGGDAITRSSASVMRSAATSSATRSGGAFGCGTSSP